MNKEEIKSGLIKYLRSCNIEMDELHEPSIIWIGNQEVDQLYIRWRKNQNRPIKELLLDLKFLDDKPFHVNSQAIYEEFMDAGLDVKMSRCFTRSFMKYFYENDSWRVRMNDVWAEWEYYLSNEDDIEKVKIALRNFVRNYNE